MNDTVCTVLMNLIDLAARMMPIFVCLDPKHSYGEDIAAISVYLWVIMISMESMFHISPQVFFVFRGMFPCPYFLMLLIFFKETLLKKGFLYISAWLSAVLSASLNEFAAQILKGHVPLTYGQIYVAVFPLWTCEFYGFVRFWLRNKVNRLFGQLSRRPCSLLLTYPSVPLFILFIGNNTMSSSRSLAEWGLRDTLFYLTLCTMILVLYVLTLSSILEIIRCRRIEEGLQFTGQLISQQREHYNQTLSYIEQVRITGRDFRHHIHVLLNIDRGERANYLTNLKRELDMTAGMVFCRNQAINGLLQKYAAKTRQDGVEFTARVDLSAHVPVGDLTSYIVTGGLLENALETCRRLAGPHFILVRARWLDDHLMILVGNSYNGQIKESGSRMLFSKRDGGLGIPGIERTLSQPGDESDMDYNNITFVATAKIVGRTLGQDVLSGPFPAQDKVKASQSSRNHI